MKYKVEVEKKTFTERYSKILLGNILTVVFIVLCALVKENFQFDISDDIIYMCMFALGLWLIYNSRNWNKIYIYEINCDEDILSINYFYFNELKKYSFNKGDIKIVKERVPVRSFTPKFKLVLMQGGFSVTQYSNAEWDNNKIDDVYNNLIKWQNG